MINSVECPEMSTQDIIGFVEGCTVDTMHAMLDEPPAEAAEPFLERCSFDQANQNVCSQCNAFQTCDSNQCVTVGSACGYGCSPLEQGSCDEANNVCVCTADYVGEHCELAVSPCTSHPCENGGTCIAEGLQPMCSCPDGFVGVSCQLCPLCTNRKEESSTGRIV
ncbi:hypothetical protein SARC_08626 [Sphaeroforma arctica JP610]|uniref:EGF-like domain-containing protein n=1 Tax=Sphaeroforma arctica JP610 TaxID=667725 RepID=A0A0L0FSK6_9EUKA|nr:hypothetical protein SARC_08626 [Sphaeroforma arctica JP610]KNC78963.1 hypothetical protein SARC_08626 [Sphaeroforma arctica JP610]|eukprot:XP_014152865.1 hypothetical protein SARC_08626 [Sphaeroforma arctica JP610]